MRPEWISHGVDYKPVIQYRDPVERGYFVVQEVMFGATPDERVDVANWGLPIDWLETELNCANLNKLVVYRVEDNGMEPSFEFGDRLIIDLSNNRPSPSGTFLIWNGVSVALAKLMVYPSVDPKKPLKAKVSYGANAETQEIPIENLTVFGRVKGVWKRT